MRKIIFVSAFVALALVAVAGFSGSMQAVNWNSRMLAVNWNS